MVYTLCWVHFLQTSSTRLLRANLLQPLKDIETINARLDFLVKLQNPLSCTVLYRHHSLFRRCTTDKVFNNCECQWCTILQHNSNNNQWIMSWLLLWVYQISLQVCWQIKMRGGESFELMSCKILLQLQDELTSEEPIFFGLSQLLQKFPKNIGGCNSDQGVVFQYIACNQFWGSRFF